MKVDNPIPAGEYPVDVTVQPDQTIIAEIVEGDHKGEKVTLSPRGITKKSHEEPKARRKMAARSRKLNRKKRG